MLDALLRGRAWIGLMFVLLAGIVFFNVDLLQMNKQIATNADRAAAIGRENARLRTDLARLGSSERIQRVAAQAGLVMPAPGEVRYLISSPEVDARRAARRIEAGQVTADAAPSQPKQREPQGAQPDTVTPAPETPAPVAAPQPAPPQPTAPALGTQPSPQAQAPATREPTG